MGFHPLDLLRLIPVCPRSCGLHKLQAPLLYRLRPGQWVQYCCGLQTNWRRERWTIKLSSGGAPNAQDVMVALSKCESLTEQPTRKQWAGFTQADFSVHEIKAHKFVCFFFTHFRQWLDCCEIELEPAPSGSGEPALVVSAYSFSASVVPAASPLALLQAIILFWVPFGDIGQNELHLRALRKLLQDEGMLVDIMGSSRPSVLTTPIAMH